MRTSTKTLRIVRLLFFVVLLRPLGNLSMAWGMKSLPALLSIHPSLYLRALFNPYVAGGILLLIISLLSRMALLSLADLSYVLPLTAFGYVFSSLLGEVVLREKISWVGWLGTLFIFAGTAMVGVTASNSTSKDV
jgi:drug/metabolite transporter (DMT)-like permease